MLLFGSRLVWLIVVLLDYEQSLGLVCFSLLNFSPYHNGYFLDTSLDY